MPSAKHPLLAAGCLLALALAPASAQDASPGVRVITGQQQGQPAKGGAAAGAGSGRPNPLAAKVVMRNSALLSLLDEYVEFLMRENPTWASTRGDERFNDQLRDESPAAYSRRGAAMTEFLDRVKKIDRAIFTDDDRLDADLLEYELSLAVHGIELHLEQMPINAMDGPHVWLAQLSDTVPMRSPKHLLDYAARLEKMPVQIDQLIGQMRAGLAAGRTPPREVLKHVVAACSAQGQGEFAADATQSPFYRPYSKPGIVNESAAAKAREAIAKGIVPAFARLAAFLKDEYIPKCRDAIGYSTGVDGKSAYGHMLRFHTTTDKSADVIHALGLKEVARLRNTMLETIAQTDFPRGDYTSDDELFAGFLKYLRTDPRFYFTDPEEMLAGYRDICKRIDPELPKLFTTLPRNTYGVRAIPKFAASTSPAAYCYQGSIRSGVPGYFMVNASNLSRRPKYGMISLTMHEAVPGHHFQLSIADELDSVHTFRTLSGYTAYIEGWALYCEKLGFEMDPGTGLRTINHDTKPAPNLTGFYADPYDNFGRLSDEIWRACRLVVDTGIHAQGWTREAAIKYMMENTAGTELDLVSEVDRYISWPGQACAYKVGELTISGLRKAAQENLGDKFDLRAFHELILSGGALPMPVLEKRVLGWIAMKANGAK